MERNEQGEITKIGCTLVADHPNAKIMFYISSMDDSGRDVQWGWNHDEAKVKADFEESKPINYDMQLYASLVNDLGDDGFDIIDDEVLDTFWEGDDGEDRGDEQSV